MSSLNKTETEFAKQHEYQRQQQQEQNKRTQQYRIFSIEFRTPIKCRFQIKDDVN